MFYKHWGIITQMEREHLKMSVDEAKEVIKCRNANTLAKSILSITKCHQETERKGDLIINTALYVYSEEELQEFITHLKRTTMPSRHAFVSEKI